MDLFYRVPGLEMCNLPNYLSLLKGRGGDISTDTWEVSGNPLVMPRHSLQQGLLTRGGKNTGLESSFAFSLCILDESLVLIPVFCLAMVHVRLAREFLLK